jgi:hypothetical protein
MIPKAREVRLKPKIRKVLEARCRGTDDSAARREAGAHSVAGGGGAQHAFDCRGSRCPAAHCQRLAAALCRARPWWAQGPPTGGARSRSTARPRTSAFWCFWRSHRLRVMPGGRVRCWPRPWPTLMFSMSGASCASTILTLLPASLGRSKSPPEGSARELRRGRFALLKHFLMRLIVRLWMGCFPQRSVWRKRCK